MTPCGECGRRAASVFISMTINGAHVDVSLCDECAERRTEYGSIAVDVPLEEERVPQAQSESPQPLVDPTAFSSRCPRCGLSAEQFAQTELLGCDLCYVAHAELLEAVLHTVQGLDIDLTASAPAGELLGKAERVNALVDELEEAVRLEQYLRAAELRDEIRTLRAELGEEVA
jgi:protein arginine kinase activator